MGEELLGGDQRERGGDAEHHHQQVMMTMIVVIMVVMNNDADIDNNDNIDGYAMVQMIVVEKIQDYDSENQQNGF